MYLCFRIHVCRRISTYSTIVKIDTEFQYEKHVESEQNEFMARTSFLSQFCRFRFVKRISSPLTMPIRTRSAGLADDQGTAKKKVRKTTPKVAKKQKKGSKGKKKALEPVDNGSENEFE